ncbi:regulatory protein RecX [Treponema pedis]|uniref:regulatory protein RecX n=1 Tax=Treponema pedis TaxID=409322 RepID=UPI001CEF7C54|nr:regulatory protein RecX [Treponema pedis]
MSAKNTVSAVHAEDSSSANANSFFVADICSASSGLIKVVNSEGVSFLTRAEYFNEEHLQLLTKTCGALISGDLLDALLNAVRRYAVETAAMIYLNRAEHSRFQLEIKLKKKDFSAGDIKIALDYLSDKGFLNDGRFAAAWLNTRRISKKEGRKRLASELALRGVNFAVAEKALSDFFSENSEEDICRTALKRQSVKYKDKQKLLRSMQRLGFSMNLINLCLEEIKNNSASYYN